MIEELLQKQMNNLLEQQLLYIYTFPVTRAYLLLK